MKHPAYYDTDAKTSKRMANVKLKRGDAEITLAKALWHKGYRYRLNFNKLPGSPDIAIMKYHIAVFVDGEFWHGYDWPNKKLKLKRNREYWIEKIEENMARDIRVDKMLIALGWIPVHFWSKEVIKNRDECLSFIDEMVLQERIESIHWDLSQEV